MSKDNRFQKALRKLLNVSQESFANCCGAFTCNHCTAAKAIKDLFMAAAQEDTLKNIAQLLQEGGIDHRRAREILESNGLEMSDLRGYGPGPSDSKKDGVKDGPHGNKSDAKLKLVVSNEPEPS